MDDARKTSVKRAKVPTKKRGEPVKVVVPRGKGNLKQPSDVEVASARPVKQSKKAMPNPAVSATVTRVVVGVLGSKGGAGVNKGARPLRNTTSLPCAFWWRLFRSSDTSHCLTVKRLETHCPKSRQGQSLTVRLLEAQCLRPCQGRSLKLHCNLPARPALVEPRFQILSPQSLQVDKYLCMFVLLLKKC
jgi:hypothetical protein